MKRELIPGVWGRSGRAIRDPQASEMDNVVPPRRDYRQGRDCQTPVPRVSIYAGKPAPAMPRRLSPMKRALAAAIGSWLAFALLLWLAKHGGDLHALWN